jgi:alpha-L-fucosidase
MKTVKEGEKMIERRSFLRVAGSALSGSMVAGCSVCRFGRKRSVPPHLKDYAVQYAADPRTAAQQWFKEAGFGLFLHYGLYSLLEGEWNGVESKPAEWIMLRAKIPIREYEKLAARFNPAEFDADFITDLALAAGMKYVNLTSKHHDGFCLFDPGRGSWNSVAASGRDLCGELAEQCHKKGLGCFFYYSLLADWHHPYFYPRVYNQIARPDYLEEPEQYLFRSDEDFKKYLADATMHIRALLTNYGDVAGIWIDPLMGYYGRPDLFPMNEIYAMIRDIQPHCLISAKQGITGSEDFAAPERSGSSLTERITKQYGAEAGKIAAHAWELNRHKHNEICDTLQPHSWGHMRKDDGKHKKPSEVLAMLSKARQANANLLLNSGPLPNGAIHPEDVATLRRVGEMLNKNR